MSNQEDKRYTAFDFGDHPSGNSVVNFRSVFNFPGWDKAPDWILAVIDKYASKDILEVGSGANPTLSSEKVASLNLRYTANDISAEELQKADKVFSQWVGDLATVSLPPEMQNRFDLVFSRMVNEHIADGRAYHSNIHQALKPGGISAHCFSTLYCLPFTVNRLVPDFLGNLLLNIFMPRDSHKLGKFRAYYSWSRGPSRAMLARFESLGFEVIEYIGYFGHAYYARIPILHRLESIKARFLLANPMPLFCSYGVLILRKR